MAQEDYDNIELTQEEMDGLNDIIISPATKTGVDESTDSQATDKVENAVQSAESVDETEKTTTEEAPIDGETESEVDPAEAGKDGFEIDGERYDREAIMAWREDSTNKESWQKSNTEKAQNLSKWSKLSEKINGDDSFREHIKDFFFDDPEAVKSLGLDGDIDIPALIEETAEISPELNQRLQVLEKIEGERIMEHRVDQLDTQLTTLEEKFPQYLEGDKVGAFLEYADKNADRFVDNGLPNLDRAFREYIFAEMQTELAHYKKLGKNSSRNEGKIIGTAQVGAKEVKTAKQYTFDNITMDDPEIAKYFENE